MTGQGDKRMDKCNGSRNQLLSFASGGSDLCLFLINRPLSGGVVSNQQIFRQVVGTTDLYLNI